MPNSGQWRCEYSKIPTCAVLASYLHAVAKNEAFSGSETRTATMLDTALLIASALSVALLVAFSDLP